MTDACSELISVLGMQLGVLMLGASGANDASPVSVSTCNTFVKHCNARLRAGDRIGRCQEAVWSLLQQMQPPALPHPAVSTFRLATECALLSIPEGHAEDTAHHALVQLQQHVWEKMHNCLPDEASQLAVYSTALLDFPATEAVQAVLLMAHHGLSGLDFECCEALYDRLYGHAEQSKWLHQVFGEDWLSRVEEVASQDDAQPHSIVPFPSCKLPKLAVYQLSNGTSVFSLDDMATPEWMWPSAAWQDAKFVQEMQARQAGGTEALTPYKARLSPAEELLQQYGHVEKRHNKKGHKQ